MLERAHSAILIEKNIAILNSQTITARVTKGEVLPNCAVMRVNYFYKKVNLVQLKIFTKK